jgi:integrase
MAMVRKRGASSWELRVKHKLLPRGAFHATFSGETGERDARAYGEQLEALLARGLVPRELLEQAPSDAPTLGAVIRDYLAAGVVKESAAEVLDQVRAEHASVTMDRISYRWAEAWVRSLKTANRLAPGTIRKRVGALARCLDWHARQTDTAAPNPLRLLPRGYSTYNDTDASLAGLVINDAPRDNVRDRRLEPGEEARIRAVLAGEKRADRERAMALPEREALLLLFELALETAMRLSEIYTLEVSQVQLAKRTISLSRTKNGDGRQVPLSTVAIALLEQHLVRRVGLLFPWVNPNAVDRAALCQHEVEQPIRADLPLC